MRRFVGDSVIFVGPCENSEKTIGGFDLLIAATALQHNLILLTNDRKHFKDIAGLQIESA
jgi:predicted nucleic acid-binding protein